MRFTYLFTSTSDDDCFVIEDDDGDAVLAGQLNPFEVWALDIAELGIKPETITSIEVEPVDPGNTTTVTAVEVWPSGAAAAFSCATSSAMGPG